MSNFVLSVKDKINCFIFVFFFDFVMFQFVRMLFFKLIEKIVLIIVVFIAGLCFIVYELFIFIISFYFFGDSVKQFFFIIGVYMVVMGVGFYFFKFIGDCILFSFIWIELGLGFIGGVSVFIFYGFFYYFMVG